MNQHIGIRYHPLVFRYRAVAEYEEVAADNVLLTYRLLCSVYGNDIGTEGAAALATFLERNQTLQKLE